MRRPLLVIDSEKPRAVLVAWDALDEPTYRRQALDTYQAGREFDAQLVDQLELLPDLVIANDFLAAATAMLKKETGCMSNG
jgi:5'-3' exonuclease